jgi:hypothetical protein
MVVFSFFFSTAVHGPSKEFLGKNKANYTLAAGQHMITW